MTKRSLEKLMHLVLAAAATDAAIACGGAVASVSAESEETPATPPDPKRGKKPIPEPDDPPERPQKDAGSDTSTDASSDVTTKPDVVTTCFTGSVEANPKYCCDPNDPNCGLGGGGDQELCKIDCQAVCNDVAPGPKNWDWCTYGQNGKTINYYCGACGVGRIPGGTVPCERGSSVGERLAMQAYYEAVSVIAFERLADALEREGAPASLVMRARKAAAEEDRHAAIFRALAEQNGATVREPNVVAESGSLLELACENAREGQVRETHGALVVLHQARHAKTPEIREAFALIADDEISHAALSSDLATWFEGKLTRNEQAIVARARREAARELREAQGTHDPIDDFLGMPTLDNARAMFDDLFARLDHKKRKPIPRRMSLRA